jgi:hypothetical protein
VFLIGYETAKSVVKVQVSPRGKVALSQVFHRMLQLSSASTIPPLAGTLHSSNIERLSQFSSLDIF